MREDMVQALPDCKTWLGGVTKAIVGDNMKAVVSKGHKYAPLINKTLKDLALHYGCVIDPTRPYHPKDKALVEGAVQLDRKSTRLNSSHVAISYAVFCLKKKTLDSCFDRYEHSLTTQIG